MKFKEIREKSVKGITIKRYLENPTGSDIYRWMQNSKYGEIRLLDFDGVLYAWDAWDKTHADFMIHELKYAPNYRSADYRDEYKGHIMSNEMDVTTLGTELLKNHKDVIMTFMHFMSGEYRQMDTRSNFSIWAYREPELVTESMDDPYDWTKTSDVSYTFHVNIPDDPMKQDIVDVDFNPDFHSSVEITFSVNGKTSPRDRSNSVISTTRLFSTVLDIIQYYDANFGEDIQTYLIAGTSRKLNNVYMRMVKRYLPNSWKSREDSGIIFIRKP